MSSNNKKKKRSPLLEALLHPGGEPASLHDSHDTAKENPLLRALRLEIEAQQRKKRPRP